MCVCWGGGGGVCCVCYAKQVSNGLTNHVNCGPPRPRPRMLLDGVIESGLTQLDGSHADPEAQAEQPGHDRTHLLRTSRTGVNPQCITFSTYDLTTSSATSPPPPPSACTHLESWAKMNTSQFSFKHFCLQFGLNAPQWRFLVIRIYH